MEYINEKSVSLGEIHLLVSWDFCLNTQGQFQFGLVFLMPCSKSFPFPVLTNSISAFQATLQQARSCLTYAQLQLNCVRVPASKEAHISVLTCVEHFWIFQHTWCQNTMLHDSSASKQKEHPPHPPF